MMVKRGDIKVAMKEIDGNDGEHIVAMMVKRGDIRVATQKRRRADIATGTSEKASRYRQDIARGPVSMAEIRLLQDALYR